MSDNQSDADKQVQEMIALYESGKSLREIAKQFNTYSKAIDRKLKRAGVTLRNRSDAQKLRLETGKAAHPTEGKPRPQNIKDKISDGVHTAWEDMSEEERKRRRQVAKKNFDNREDKEEFRLLGQKGIARAAKEGSALELFVADALTVEGFYTLIHQKHVIENTNMHLDILLPNDNIAIEIDGPSHYEEVWSKENLKRVKKTDEKKNGLLILGGYDVIRVSQPRNVSLYFKRQVCDKLIKQIKKIQNKKSKRARVYYL